MFCKQGKVFEVVVSDGPADRSVKPIHHTSGMNVRVYFLSFIQAHDFSCMTYYGDYVSLLKVFLFNAHILCTIH